MSPTISPIAEQPRIAAPFEVTAQLIDKLTSLQQRSGAKGEHEVLSLTFIRMVNPPPAPHFATTYIVPSS